MSRQLTRNSSHENVVRARELRSAMSRHEKKLWYDGLNNHRLGFHFRRQHPFGPFFLDFFAAGPKVAIELDGPILQSRQIEEWDRDQDLKANGILTLRFMNGELSQDLDAVLAKIQKTCYERSGGFDYSPKFICFEHAEDEPPPCPPPTPASQGEAL